MESMVKETLRQRPLKLLPHCTEYQQTTSSLTPGTKTWPRCHCSSHHSVCYGYQHHEHCQNKRVRLKLQRLLSKGSCKRKPYLDPEQYTQNATIPIQSKSCTLHPPTQRTFHSPGRSASNAKRGTKDPAAQHTGSGGRIPTRRLSDVGSLGASMVFRILAVFCF